MAHYQGSADGAAVREQKFARLLACGREIVVDGLPRLLSQLESGHRPAFGPLLLTPTRHQ